LPFLSNSILQYFEEIHQPFIFNYSSSLRFTLEDLISCYSLFDSLFRNQTKLVIEPKNISIFHFIAQSLRNSYLALTCNKVTSAKTKLFH
jgi:hypothetical protein